MSETTDLTDAINGLRQDLARRGSTAAAGGARGGGGDMFGGAKKGAGKLFGALDPTKTAGDFGADFLPREGLAPPAQYSRMAQQAKDYEATNRKIMEEGGEDIRTMYGKMATENESLFDAMGRQARQHFGDHRAGLQTMVAMYREIGQMPILSTDSMKNVAETTLALHKLGVPAKETAGTIDTLTNAYGLSAEKSTQMARGVYDLATALQKSPAKMASEFRHAAKNLAYDADKVGSVFAGIQRQSRITGIEYGTLMKTFGDSMDTFEGSAKAAGSLNAVLGGPYLNSIELLTASEDDRIQMVQDAFKESGKSVDELGKFELKSIAKQLGMDPEDARRLLRGDATREKLTGKIDERLEKGTVTTVDEATGEKKLALTASTASAGLSKLQDRFQEMIGPAHRTSIFLNNIAEIGARRLAGGTKAEGRHIRDALEAGFLGVPGAGGGARRFGTYGEGAEVQTQIEATVKGGTAGDIGKLLLERAAMAQKTMLTPGGPAGGEDAAFGAGAKQVAAARAQFAATGLGEAGNIFKAMAETEIKAKGKAAPAAAGAAATGAAATAPGTAGATGLATELATAIRTALGGSPLHISLNLDGVQVNKIRGKILEKP